MDDDVAIRAALKELLDLAFAASIGSGELLIDTAADGEEAVELATDHPPDLMIMDVHMPPGIDGIEAFHRLRDRRNGQPVRTLFLTGYGSAGNVSERLADAIQLGAIGYLLKPVPLDDLRRRVEQALGLGTGTSSG